MTRLNAMGMPSIAMWMQCGLVTVFILLVSFGGGTASAFFNKLTLMANVSMTLPYLFLALAFPFFKARQDLDRPFVIFKTRMSAMIATVVVVLVVTFANVFTIIQPVVEAGDWDSTLWMIGGPVFFSLLAMAIYQNYCSRVVKIRSGWLSNQMPYRRPDDRRNDRELVRFRMRYSEIKLWVTS